MSKDSREEREQLKEAYKRHYRKIREAKKRLSQSRRKKNIADALRNMDTSEVTETFDEFLYKVKNKIASVEARLDVAMDSLAMSEKEEIEEAERDEELKKAKARETLKQAKIEMGMLYNEIEQQADTLQVTKTIGSSEPAEEAEQMEADPKEEQSEKGQAE